MKREYLPSKLFMFVVAFIILILAVVFGITKLVSYFKNKSSNNAKAPKAVIIQDLVQKDANNNGIADWEEYLWGLDPNKNGPENKEFILAKKKTLLQNEDGTTNDSNEKITENESISRQFFATIISLQQTGELNPESIKSVSDSFGKNVESIEITDIYNNSMMTIVNDGTLAKTNYENALTKLVIKYQDADIGNELNFIIQGLNNKDFAALYAAKSIAEAYQSFGREFIKIPTPRSLIQTHLSAANNYEKVGQTITGLTQVLSDPIVGMRAIQNYKKYSDVLGNDLDKISLFLQ